MRQERAYLGTGTNTQEAIGHDAAVRGCVWRDWREVQRRSAVVGLTVGGPGLLSTDSEAQAGHRSWKQRL